LKLGERFEDGVFDVKDGLAGHVSVAIEEGIVLGVHAREIGLTKDPFLLDGSLQIKSVV
jgi:hypothetical protein